MQRRWRQRLGELRLMEALIDGSKQKKKSKRFGFNQARYTRYTRYTRFTREEEVEALWLQPGTREGRGAATFPPPHRR